MLSFTVPIGTKFETVFVKVIVSEHSHRVWVGKGTKHGNILLTSRDPSSLRDISHFSTELDASFCPRHFTQQGRKERTLPTSYSTNDRNQLSFLYSSQT